jgi:hypothetical protein
VIRIRYKDLAPGLHGKAERRARGVTVYLVPGLTGRQRKAVLRRLRQEASRGCGPALPMPQLAVALSADWIRTNLKNTAAVVRLHPAGSLLSAAAACVLMILFVMAPVPVMTPVSVRIARVPGSGPGGSPPVRGGDSGSAQSVADPATGKAGGQANPALSLAASSGTGYGGTGLGAGARSWSRVRGGPGAGSGSTSGSGTGSRAP